MEPWPLDIDSEQFRPAPKGHGAISAADWVCGKLTSGEAHGRGCRGSLLSRSARGQRNALIGLCLTPRLRCNPCDRDGIESLTRLGFLVPL